MRDRGTHGQPSVVPTQPDRINGSGTTTAISAAATQRSLSGLTTM
jgi:hypothetical protein